jgi:hypothetical protein
MVAIPSSTAIDTGQRPLPVKNQAEYDPDPVPAAEAVAGVEAARRIDVVAEQVVRSIRG